MRCLFDSRLLRQMDCFIESHLHRRSRLSEALNGNDQRLTGKRATNQQIEATIADRPDALSAAMPKTGGIFPPAMINQTPGGWHKNLGLAWG